METNTSFNTESRMISEGDIEYFSFSNHKKQSLVPPEHMLFEIGSITKVFTSIFML